MASIPDIIQGINSLKVAYPNYNPDAQATATLWEQLFSDIEGDTLKAAILVCLTERRAFAPSVGEIRASAMDLHAKAAGIPDAYMAYDEVCKMPADMEMRRLSDDFDTETGHQIIYVHKLVFTHPIVEAVARQMGWPKTFPTDNPGVDRGQFRQAYESELARVMSDAGRLPIIQQYIESKRPELQGRAPALESMSALTKKIGAPK